MTNKEIVMRREVAKCEPDKASIFIISLKKNGYICRSEKKADGKVHQDRYKFYNGTDKVSVVYDTKAKKLCLDAVYEVLNSLEEILKGEEATSAIVTTQPTASVPISEQRINVQPTASVENTLEKLPPQKIKLPPKQEKKPIAELTKQVIQSQTELPKQVQKPQATPPKQVAAQNKANTKTQTNAKAQATPVVAVTNSAISAPNDAVKSQSTTTAATQSTTITPTPTTAPTTAELEYKNGFSVKKISAAKLEKFIEKVNMLPSIKMLENNTKTSGIISYIFEDKAKQKVTVRYVEAAMVVQLQGKRSNLFSEMQVLISRDTDYLEAVGSHIVLVNENKKAGEIHKLLKKRIPDAYNFLTDQSKIDMTYGLIDINNEKVFLSDYSVLLVPPYRGLEKFIYDLQQAKEIAVKMIGQAFDKADGKYVLKAGYRKKINSVIYEEVLTSLYTEYFEKRNFYAHSDCTDGGVNRGISEKSVAKSIFDNLLDTVNYNCKKLKEINFEINLYSKSSSQK